MKIKNKILSFLFAITLPLFGSDSDCALLSCQPQVHAYKELVAHHRDQLVDITQSYIKTHPLCDCEILTEASKIITLEERMQLITHINTWHPHDKERLIKCLKANPIFFFPRPMILLLPQMQFPPIEDDKPATKPLN